MSEPDFSEFDDWLEEKTGPWPEPWENKRCTPKQKAIVDRNAALLLQRALWCEKVERFEAALTAIGHEDDLESQRARYRIHFDRHHFNKTPEEYDFSEYRFPCSVSFDRSSIESRNVSFENSRFLSGETWFTNVNFGNGLTSFNYAIFSGINAWFSRSTFGGRVTSFLDVSFGHGNTSFDETTFNGGDVSFDGTKFGKRGVSFANAKFYDCFVDFTLSNFEVDDVHFTGCCINNGKVVFDKTIFSTNNIWFNGCDFVNSSLIFRSSNLNSKLFSFIGSEFANTKLLFDNTIFGSGNVSCIETYFYNCSIGFIKACFGAGGFAFSPSTFKTTDFLLVDSKVDGNLLVASRFSKSASFERLSVGGTARFSDCVFAEIPDFRDAKFDRPPEVARMGVPLPKRRRKRFLGRAWGKAFSSSSLRKRPKRFPWLRWTGLFRTAADADDVAKLRKLKAMAIAANDHERDSYFFAREMMAKRGVETVGFWPLLLDSAYALLSNYGQSISRPFWGFIASVIGFAVVYALPLLLLGKIGFGQVAVFAAEYSAHNFFPLLNTLFRFALTPSGFTTGFESRLDAIHRQLFIQSQTGLFDWIIAASVFQQLFGGVLLFLLLLGLRNKFRLK